MDAEQLPPAPCRRAPDADKNQAAGRVRRHVWLTAEADHDLAGLLKAWPLTGQAEAISVALRFLNAATRAGLQRLDLATAERLGAALRGETVTNASCRVVQAKLTFGEPN